MKLNGIVPTWVEVEGASFELRPLTPPERLECLSYGDVHSIHKMYRKAIGFALVDWKNIEDEGGKAIEFDLALVETLPDTVWSQIARSILGFNSLGSDEKKT